MLTKKQFDRLLNLWIQAGSEDLIQALISFERYEAEDMATTIQKGRAAFKKGKGIPAEGVFLKHASKKSR